MYSNYSFSLCSGDSIKILGNWIKEAKTLNYTLKTYRELDTINTYSITVKNHLNSPIYQSIVQGDSTFFINRWLKITGKYDHILTAKNGCDSTLTLHLTVHTFSNSLAGPTTLTARGNGSGIDLEWIDNSSNEDGFVIERFIDNYLKFRIIDSVGSNIQTFTDHKVEPGVDYHYRVFAFNSTGISHYSNIASGNTNTITGFEVLRETDLKVFPNPGKNIFNVQLPYNCSNSISFKVVDYMGRTILTKTILNLENLNNALEIDLSDYPEGIYCLTLQTGKVSVRKKLIKKHY